MIKLHTHSREHVFVNRDWSSPNVTAKITDALETKASNLSVVTFNVFSDFEKEQSA